MARITEWRKLPVALTELCLATTLRCGQSFRWRHNEEDDTWACPLRGRIIQLSQDTSSPSTDHIRYRSIWPSAPAKTSRTLSTKIKQEKSKTNSKRASKKRGGTASSLTATPLTPPSSHPSSQNSDAEDNTNLEPALSSTTHTTTTTDHEDDTLAFLIHYLNLQPNLSSLYRAWSLSDHNFASKAPRFTGVRILRQDAWETLIGFICSSNNNIARISQMMEKLCLYYGPPLGTVDGRTYHDFPTARDLLGNGVEAHLRELGFGYRAKYIANTARLIIDLGGEEWLDSLRNPDSPAYDPGHQHHAVPNDDTKPVSQSPSSIPTTLTSQPSNSTSDPFPAEGRPGYHSAHTSLLTLSGVGPKVADCICLMGLGWGEAVPVDTHVWAIAQRDYKMFRGGKNASMTKAAYDAIGNHFRGLWGKEAGWAHSVLFTADLRAFSDRMVAKREEVVGIKEEAVVEAGLGADAGEEKIDVKVKAEIKVEDEDDVDARVVTKVRTAVKRELEVEDGSRRKRHALVLDEVQVNSSLSDRVKRRRRGQT